MGSNTSVAEVTDDMMEVYILIKTIGHHTYWTVNPNLGHHICLFKTTDGKLYYTDLQTDNGDKNGKIELRFGQYQFFNNRIIAYCPVGYTRKTLTEIDEFRQNHNTIGTIYSLWTNNCQHYVRDCIKFLEIKTRVPLLNDGVYTAQTSSDLTLHPNLSDNVDQQAAMLRWWP
ncbi:unnamed protein product [Rotaria sp. Silwood2]|nr:unnamed protein product [Rotaria sp. Silwood2]